MKSIANEMERKSKVFLIVSTMFWYLRFVGGIVLMDYENGKSNLMPDGRDIISIAWGFNPGWGFIISLGFQPQGRDLIL